MSETTSRGGRRHRLDLTLAAMGVAAVLGAAPVTVSGVQDAVALPAVIGDEVDELRVGESLGPGQALESPGGRVRLQVDLSGKATLVDGARWPGFEVWKLNGDSISQLIMQGDGNVVGYGPRGAVFSLGTAGTGATRLRVQDDRNIVLLDDASRVVAHTGTYRGRQLAAGDVLLPDESVPGAGGRSRLVMQGDGNLVLYRDGAPLWASGTAGHPGAEAVMQGDGNLVVYSSWSTGRRDPLWMTGTTTYASTLRAPTLLVGEHGLTVVAAAGQFGSAAVWGTAWTSDRLEAGDALVPGDRRQSRSGRCSLVVQQDLNVVEYCGGAAAAVVGTPRSTHSPATRTWTLSLNMQEDGNLVSYQHHIFQGFGPRTVFVSGTSVPGSALTVQDDGNLVVRTPDGRPQWSVMTGRIG